MSNTRSREIRGKLKHPILDADAHIVEFEPVFLDYLKQVGGEDIVKRYKHWRDNESWFRWYGLTPEQRREKRAVRPPWWTTPTKNVLDRATVMLPKLFHERLDEFGIDFAVVYPSMALQLYRSVANDAELRQALCRAFNTLHADVFREFGKRMAVAAVIPTYTPEEAIVELEHATRVLGLKVAHVGGSVVRPVDPKAKVEPGGPPRATWIDTLALDSIYDYDPVWKKCVELGVPAISHSSGMTWGSRTSVTNYMYNHIGCFAAGAESFCRALFMGGVPNRFPGLKFGFLEGGAGWASNLYADIVGHWKKRHVSALDLVDPAQIDKARFLNYCREYGHPAMQRQIDHLLEPTLMRGEQQTEAHDDWAACKIARKEDIRDIFNRNFYFGCEADDPMSSLAFNTRVNPMRARLNAMFSSDIGHWDVTDAAEVVEEGYELIEHELLSEADFQDYAFGNAARLYAGMNPRFFDGTILEDSVRKLFASDAAAR